MNHRINTGYTMCQVFGLPITCKRKKVSYEIKCMGKRTIS